MKTIADIVKVLAALVPATRTTTTSSEPVLDTAGQENVCYVVAAGNGTFGGLTPETYSFQVYESDSSDGSTPTAISGAVVAITADDQVKKIQISSLGTGARKRYQFCRLTAAGTSPSLPCTVLAEFGPAHYGPAQAADVSV